jgi:hypothetical protein
MEMIGCLIYQRDFTKLDIEILHYVYDNTGPGSKLRVLFAHISTYYGYHDVFAQMPGKMPQVFNDDCEAKEADKASKRKGGVAVVAWDVTEFLLAEVLDSDNPVEVKAEPVGDTTRKRRRDTLTEDRQSRRRTTREG